MKLTTVNQELFNFLERASLQPHPILDKVVEETAKLPDAMMQIPKHQGAFMYLLIKILGVKSAVELGCYTGYSAIAMASALPTDGKLTTFDIDPKTSAIAKKYFAEADLEHKIELRLGPALQEFKNFMATKPKASIDFVFIDADKVNYDHYYEMTLDALRSGGVMLLDNTFRDGEILAPAPKDIGTQVVEKLIQKIKVDRRVEAGMLPIADGVYIIRKL